MRAVIKNNSTKISFTIVGIINTLIDFGILIFLTVSGVSVIPANIISTTSAFSFSFFANKKFTFKTTDTNVKREALLFLVVTVFGSWVLQGAVIQLVVFAIDKSLPLTYSVIVAKIAGAAVSLTWNYLLYSRVVFKKAKKA